MCGITITDTKKKKKKDILGSQGLLNIKDGAFR